MEENELLLQDNRRMRQAGMNLATAAMHVAQHYDGIHRLMLAVKDWSDVIAHEGGRPHDDPKQDLGERPAEEGRG